MKTFLFFIFMMSPAIAQAEFCNWGFSGPEIHRCNGETYYFGGAACESGFYREIFCHEKFNQDGKACAGDNSPETLDCYKRMVKPRPVDPAPETDEWCNWGVAGPDVITCENQKFVFGTAACPSGMYTNVFCKEEHSRTGKACNDDNSEVTIRCYNKTIGARPANGDSFQKPTKSSGVANE